MKRTELVKDKWYLTDDNYYIKFDHAEGYKTWVTEYINPEGAHYVSRGFTDASSFRELTEEDYMKHPEMGVHTTSTNYEIY